MNDVTYHEDRCRAVVEAVPGVQAVVPMGRDGASAGSGNLLDVALDEVVVAGDTGNDADMFLLDGVRGIIPANGRDELRLRLSGNDRIYQAKGREADGVIEGLRHWFER